MNIHSLSCRVSTLVAPAATAVVGSRGSRGSKSSRGSLRFTGSASFGWHIGLLRLPAWRRRKDFTELVAWQRADDLERFVQESSSVPCWRETSSSAGRPRRCGIGSAKHRRRIRPLRPGPIRELPSNRDRFRTGDQEPDLKAWQRGAITDEEHYVGVVLCKRAIGAATVCGVIWCRNRQERTPEHRIRDEPNLNLNDLNS